MTIVCDRDAATAARAMASHASSTSVSTSVPSAASGVPTQIRETSDFAMALASPHQIDSDEGLREDGRVTNKSSLIEQVRIKALNSVALRVSSGSSANRRSQRQAAATVLKKSLGGI